VLATALASSPLGAQAIDSTHRWSIFGGSAKVLDGTDGSENGVELGASGDFRWSPIPVPLRLSLSFSQHQDDFLIRPQRGGQASLDLVMRPIPKTLRIQPYFLGGIGVATRAPYSGVAGGYSYDPTLPPVPYYVYSRPRETWAFASAGVGLDVGRLFMQLKVEQPVAAQGPTLMPFSVGFRFWE
jgi:hypothetical protein